MSNHRPDDLTKRDRQPIKGPRIDAECLAVPLDLLARLSTVADSDFLKSSPREGLGRLEVATDGLKVATFIFPQRDGPVTSLQRLQAANEPKAYSKVGKEDQWWDDDMLDEPLEPLRDFV